MMTVTFFFSSPLVCRPLCLGVWTSSCYLRASLQVPHNHLVASPNVGPSSSLASPTRDGVGRKRTELSFTPVTIWAKGREEDTLKSTGHQEVGRFHFSLAHLTWSLPHSPTIPHRESTWASSNTGKASFEGDCRHKNMSLKVR